VEMFSGAVDVFHGTNFVLPPTRRAAGVVTIHDLGFVLHPETVDRTSLAYQRLATFCADVVGSQAAVTPGKGAKPNVT